MKAWFRPAQIANIAFLGGWFEATGTEELLALLVNPFVGNPFDAQQNRAGSMSDNERLLNHRELFITLFGDRPRRFSANYTRTERRICLVASLFLSP